MKSLYHVTAFEPVIGSQDRPLLFVGLFASTTILDTGLRAWLKLQLKKNEQHVNNGEIVPEISAAHYMENEVIRDYPVALAVYQPSLSTWTFKNWIARVELVQIIETSQDVQAALGGAN